MDIVEELRRDRESGARRLVSEYKAGLMSLARRFLANESDAEELVNATFAKVVANIDGYLEQSAFFAWMCQILTNEFRDSVKRKSKSAVIYPGVVPDVVDEKAQDEIFDNLDHSLLRDAIERLPEDMRKAVVLHYFMDMPVREAARILGTPAGTVAWRLHVARDMLAAKLGVAKEKAKDAAKSPGGKALLLALALCGLTALGAAVAFVGDAAFRRVRRDAPAQEQQANVGKGADSGLESASLLLHNLQLFTTNTTTQEENTTMKKPSLLAAALTALSLSTDAAAKSCIVSGSAERSAATACAAVPINSELDTRPAPEVRLDGLNLRTDEAGALVIIIK